MQRLKNPLDTRYHRITDTLIGFMVGMLVLGFLIILALLTITNHIAVLYIGLSVGGIVGAIWNYRRLLKEIEKLYGFKAYICPECGDNDVVRDSDTKWNLNTQQWDKLQVVYGNVTCNGCGAKMHKDDLVEVDLFEKT